MIIVGNGITSLGFQLQQWWTDAATVTDDNGTIDTSDDYQRIVSTRLFQSEGELVDGEFTRLQMEEAGPAPGGFCSSKTVHILEFQNLHLRLVVLTIAGFNGSTPLFKHN